MPSRSGPRRYHQDVPFPIAGLVETAPVNDQMPGSTIDAENVRAYPANLTVTKASSSLNATFNGRNRGGQRSGLSSYLTQVSNGNTVNLPFQDNDAPPIQEITHLTWTEVTDLYGQGHILNRNTSSGAFQMLDKDGTLIGTGTMGASDDKYQLSTWGSDGSVYVAVTTAQNEVVVRRMNTNVNPTTNQPDVVWSTADLNQSRIPIKSASKAYKPVRGMYVWADTLYVWVGSLDIAGDTAKEAIYRFDTATGVLRDGNGNNTYWMQNYGAAGVGKFHATDMVDTHYIYNNLMSIGRNRMALLTFNGQGGDTGADNLSTALAHSVGASGVRTALEGLSGISSGDVTTTLGPLSGQGIMVEFTGTLAKRNVPPISINTAGVAQVFTITCAADTGDPGYNGRYFNIYDGSNNKYTVWFKTGRSEVGVAAGGLTSLYKSIKVTIATGATNTAVASAIQTAINADSAFTATVDSNVVTVTNASVGDATDPALGDVNTVTAFIAFSTTTQGITGLQAANEVQQPRLKGAPQYGTVTAAFNHGGGTQTTGTIAYDASASAVQGRLEALSNVTATVNQKQRLLSESTSGVMILAMWYPATTLSSDINNIVTTIPVTATVGTIGGETVYDMDDNNAGSGTTALKQVMIDDEVMTISGTVDDSANTIVVTRGAAKDTQQSNATSETATSSDHSATTAQPHSSGATVYLLQTGHASSGHGQNYNDTDTTVKADLEKFQGIQVAQDQKQKVAHNAVAGSFKIEWKGVRSAAIAWNASSGTFDTALENMSNIPSGEVAVSGASWGSGKVVTFSGSLGGTDHPKMRMVEETSDFLASGGGAVSATTGVSIDTAGRGDDIAVTGTALNNSGDPLIVEFKGKFAGDTLPLLERTQAGVSSTDLNHLNVTQSVAAAIPTVNVTGGWDWPTSKETDLNGGINATVTTVNVDSATNMKVNDLIYVGASGYERQEFMKITAISTNALTVVRGYAGTVATAHSDDDDVFLKRTDCNYNFQGALAGTELNKITFTDSGLTVAADTEVKNVKVTTGAAASATVSTQVSGSSNYNEKQLISVTGGGGNVRLSWNAETVLQILDLDTGDTRSTTTLQPYGTTSNNGYSVVADRFGDFYSVSYVNGLLAGGDKFAICKTSNDGVLVWTILSDGTTRDITYDNLNDRVAVVGGNAAGTDASFVLINPANGAITHSLYPYEDTIDPDTGLPYNIIQWHNVHADHQGGFTLLRNDTTDNIARMTSASTPAEESVVSSGSSPAYGSSVASTLALNPENSLAVRQIQSFAVAGGTFREFRAKSQYQSLPVDTWVDVTGGANAFRADVPIFSAQLGQDVFFVDGTSAKFYDASAGSIVTWTPSAGSLPIDSNSNRAKLIATYRGRIVLSGVKGDPSNFFMSAVGNALDWDYGASPQTETMAVAGGASSAGKSPDKINCLIPMSDEVLILGGDHTVFALRGDIAAEGGRIDLMSDQTGTAWGQGAFCKDPYGQFYVFGSRGGVYGGRLGGEVTKITTPAVEERRATTIDLNKHLINMIWNEREHGFHLFVTPLQFGAGSSTPEKQVHYFYDARNQSWWIDTFENNNHQPRCVHVFDGDDPNDRAILVGGGDGVIRKWDPNCPTDGDVSGDTSNITSHAYLGPFQTGGETNLMLEEMVGTIAQGSGSVTYDVFVGNSAEDAYNRSTARFSGSWSEGRNKSERRRAQGKSIYVKVGNSDEQGWALEDMTCFYREVGGPVTRRAT